MGWLELLPLMKRLLPMLSQLTPMLESMLAGRMGGKAEGEQTRAAVAQLNSTLSTSHTGLLGALETQNVQLAAIGTDLRTLHATDAALQNRAAAIERRLTVLAAAVRTATVVLGVLLLLCLVLLGVLLTRHR